MIIAEYKLVMERKNSPGEEPSQIIISLGDNSDLGSNKFRLTVEPAIFSVFFAKFLANIVLTNLILVRTCHVTLHYNDTICDALGLNTEDGHTAEKLVQSHTSVLLMWKTLFMAIIPAFLLLFLGPWSDTKGRKPMIIASILGSSLMYMIYTGLSTLQNLHPFYILLGVLPLAFAGGTVNLVVAVNGYLSDITEPKDRSFRLGILQGSLVSGLLLGLLSSSFIFDAAGKYGYLAIFSLSSVTCMISFLYTHYLVPESVVVSKDSKGFNGLNLSLIKDLVVTCIKKRPNGKRAVFFLLLVSIVIISCINDGCSALEFLFMRLRFGWSYKEYSIFSSVTIVSNLIGTTGVCWIFSSYFRISDPILAIVACLSSIGQCSILIFANSNSMYLLYGSIVVGMFRQSLLVYMRSMLSKSVPSCEIGKAFALAGLMEAIAPVASGPIYTVIYNNTLQVMPGAFLLLSIFLFGICTFFLVIIFCIPRFQTDDTFLSTTVHT